MNRFARFPYYASQAFLGVSTTVAVYQALNIDKVPEPTPISGVPLEVRPGAFQEMIRNPKSEVKPVDATNSKLDTIY